MRGVGMTQRRGGLGFLDESRQTIRVLREFRKQDLQRDLAVQARILREEHLAHAARAQAGNDSIVS